jgi:hypothetical protein
MQKGLLLLEVRDPPASAEKWGLHDEAYSKGYSKNVLFIFLGETRE